ncbi:unnamed protein product, partial [Polarella glacialis]
MLTVCHGRAGKGLGRTAALSALSAMDGLPQGRGTGGAERIVCHGQASKAEETAALSALSRSPPDGGAERTVGGHNGYRSPPDGGAERTVGGRNGYRSPPDGGAERTVGGHNGSRSPPDGGAERTVGGHNGSRSPPDGGAERTVGELQSSSGHAVGAERDSSAAVARAEPSRTEQSSPGIAASAHTTKDDGGPGRTAALSALSAMDELVKVLAGNGGAERTVTAASMHNKGRGNGGAERTASAEVNRSLWPASPEQSEDGLSPASSAGGSESSAADGSELQRLRLEVEQLRAKLRVVSTLVSTKTSFASCKEELHAPDVDTAPCSSGDSGSSDVTTTSLDSARVSQSLPATLPGSSSGSGLECALGSRQVDWKLRERAYRWARSFFSLHGSAAAGIGVAVLDSADGLGGGHVVRRELLTAMRRDEPEVAAFFESPSQGFRPFLLGGEEGGLVAWDDFVDCYVLASSSAGRRGALVPQLNLQSPEAPTSEGSIHWAIGGQAGEDEGGESPFSSSNVGSSSSGGGGWLQHGAIAAMKGTFTDASPSPARDSLLISLSSCAEEVCLSGSGWSPTKSPSRTPWKLSPLLQRHDSPWTSDPLMNVFPLSIDESVQETSPVLSQGLPGVLALSPSAGSNGSGASPPPRRQRLAHWASFHEPSPPTSPEETDLSPCFTPFGTSSPFPTNPSSARFGPGPPADTAAEVLAAAYVAVAVAVVDAVVEADVPAAASTTTTTATAAADIEAATATTATTIATTTSRTAAAAASDRPSESPQVAAEVESALATCSSAPAIAKAALASSSTPAAATLPSRVEETSSASLPVAQRFNRSKGAAP